MLPLPKVIGRLLGVVLLAVVVAGAWYAFQWNARLIRIGEVRIDPLAQLNPERRYNILVWEQDLYIPSVDPEMRRKAFEAAVAELRELYPNISVDFEFLDPDDAHDRLLEALKAGVGPDIAAIVEAPFLLYPDYQVPVTAYMTLETVEDLLPAARAAVSDERDVWAWPRWLELVVWVGREPDAGHLGRWPSPPSHAVLSALGTWRERTGGEPPVAFNAYDEDLVLGILIATTGQRPFSANGELLWDRKELEEAAEFLHHLVDGQSATKQIEAMARSRLQRFWEGRAILIAPVNRNLLHHILTRLGELTHDADQMTSHLEQSSVRLFSAPYAADRWAGVHGWAAGYAVFRRPEHVGDDHTQAAMLVAHHLARRMGHWDAANMLTVPAYSSALPAWERDSGLPPEHARTLIALAQQVVAPPVSVHVARLEREATERILRPALLKLLQGELQPKAFAASVHMELETLLATIPIPANK